MEFTKILKNPNKISKKQISYLKSIIDEYQTPFYCYDEIIIDKKIHFLQNLELNFKFNFFYAVKANPNLAIINYFKMKQLILSIRALYQKRFKD